MKGWWAEHFFGRMIKALYFSVNFSLFAEDVMDNKLLICNIGFMVTTAAAIHYVSSWAQDTGSENLGYWYTDNNASSTLRKHEMRCSVCLRRSLDPMQSDAENRFDFLKLRSRKNLATWTPEARK